MLVALKVTDKIEAIRIVRAATGFGLKECKDLIEAAQRNEAARARRIGAQLDAIGTIAYRR